jgi:hypothetical protein
MYQNQSRVCVEFLKSSKGIGTRIIKLNYGPQAIPPQLVGRMDMVRLRSSGHVLAMDSCQCS